MIWLFSWALGPVAAGIGLSLVWWFLRGRRQGLPGAAVSALAAVTGILLVLVESVVRLLAGPLSLLLDVPVWFWEVHRDYRFIMPLLLGAIGLVILTFPIRGRNGNGAADLTPRTPVSFARGWWFLAPSAILALVLLVTVLAGAASQPDSETGRFTMYNVRVGAGNMMGTTIYGWFYSVPALIILAGIVLLLFLSLFLIARPALAPDPALDVLTRAVRTRNVLAVVSGALLLHLGTILTSLAGTASMRSSFRTPEGPVSFWTTFAALQPALMIAANVAVALGFAFWAAVALSAIPSRAPARVIARS
jgi:hypothetical protein